MTSTHTEPLSHLIAGARASHPSGAHRACVNPATGEVIAATPLDAVAAADAAIAAAAAAYPAWSATPVGDRIQPLFRFKALLESHAHELASLLVREHGKTIAEATGSVRRGIDCVELACAAPVLLMGRTLPRIAVSSSFCRTQDEGGVPIDSALERVPLGVCAGISPFNFPIMVPLWMWPMAVACGNTFVLKPSEKDPASAMRVVELAWEAGLPKGVLNLVHGGPAVVERLCTHPDVRAVSFVGSTRVGEIVWRAATGAGKRAQCMCGAKNHSIIMPDANRAAAVEGILGSAFGNSGQRCLAGSVVVPVGDAAEWLVPALVEGARAMRVGAGTEPGTNMGPMQDQEGLDRVRGALAAAEADGATLALDGREAAVPAHGCFIGPSIVTDVTPDMRVAREEIFGPVLAVIRAKSLEEALSVVNASEYGNMSVIFTSDGRTARRFEEGVQAGMVGVNVGVPAPMAAFPFAGWKRSFFGDLHVNGEDGARFYTASRVCVRRWIGSGD